MSWLVPVSASLSGIMALYLAMLGGPRRRAYNWLAGAMGLLAALHALTGFVPLGDHRIISLMRPMLAMGFPPLLFLHVQTLCTDRRAVRWTDALHLAGPALVCGFVLTGLISRASTGGLIDLTLLASNLAYAVACMRQLRETHPPTIRRWIWIVAAWLVTMALADLLVALELGGNTDISRSLGLVVALAGQVGFLASPKWSDCVDGFKTE